MKAPDWAPVMTSCPKCHVDAPDQVRYCPSCRFDLGAPNVRAAETNDERAALSSRVDGVLSAARAEKRLTAVMSFRHAVDRDSRVIVNMPPSFARSLVEDRRKVYANYEKLVGEELRTPAIGPDDRRRYAVDGWFFGSFGARIGFGVLSLSNEGLRTYGDVACQLRSESVDNRTSFLENNSYRFAEIHNIRLIDTSIPLGYRASWKLRADLAVAKIGDRITSGMARKDWESLLVDSDSQNRENDEFIEAHIYDGFTADSIEAIQVPDAISDRDAKLDARICVERFNEIKATRGKQ